MYFNLYCYFNEVKKGLNFIVRFFLEVSLNVKKRTGKTVEFTLVKIAF